MTGIDENKVAGGKRKNGHSLDCECHICENMINKAKRNGYTKDAKKKELQKKGAVKKNGHSLDCGCPICKNMMAKSKKHHKKQKGGDDSDSESDSSSDEETTTEMQGGRRNKKNGKKKNGHKLDCKCPICKNMKKSKKGGEDPDIEEGGIKGETSASDAEYDNLDNIQEADTNAANAAENTAATNAENATTNAENDTANAAANAAELGEAGPGYKVGGTRKRRRSNGSKRKYNKRKCGSKKKSNMYKTRKNNGSKKSNGHKEMCKCPICINMKK